MKAQLIKQHLHKQPLEISEDIWGNEVYIVEDVVYNNKTDAKLAICKLISDEFNSRNKEK